MTLPFNPKELQFYLTLPSPCPYLPDRLERKLFTQLDPFSGPHLNNYLTHAGFRRSQNVIYRPACESCSQCRSLRIVADAFAPSRSFRRTLNRNADLKVEVSDSYATGEQYDLLRRYLNGRHPGGGMSDMTFGNYEMMVEECGSHSQIVEYRTPDDELIAVMLVDVLDDGLSLVYGYFDPEARTRSLGNFMILDHIARAAREGRRFIYLGYWVPGSPKMDYKARFRPAEVLGASGWKPLQT